MSFCTAINCIDGRVQLPVITFLQKYFKAKYVDSITEPGPNLILAEHNDNKYIESISKSIEISIKKHGSTGIAVVGHYDCAGNPANKETQNIHTQEAVKYLKSKYKNIEIIGLWVDENSNITEI